MKWIKIKPGNEPQGDDRNTRYLICVTWDSGNHLYSSTYKWRNSKWISDTGHSSEFLKPTEVKGANAFYLAIELPGKGD